MPNTRARSAVMATLIWIAGALVWPSAAVPAQWIKPGLYLSDSVGLLLDLDGAFLLSELGGHRRASGRYAIGAGTLTFTSGQGDVGQTHFPLTCQVSASFNGFAVTRDQAQCRPFDGLSFWSAN
jgi:hypothetical protein